MIAISRIGCLADGIIDGCKQGSVVAVFERCAYIDISGRLICLAQPSLPIGPLMAMSADSAPISMNSHVVIAKNSTRIWYPPRPYGWTVESVNRGIDAVARMPRSIHPEGGLAPLVFEKNEQNPYSPVVAAVSQPLVALTEWLAEMFFGAVWEAPKELGAFAGLGPGLTPSGDDFIGGAMIATHILDRSDIAEHLYVALMAGADIGRVSAAHLSAACEGMASKPLHLAINDVLCGRTENLPARLEALNQMGHTSGWDAFAGFMTVMRVALHACQWRATQIRVA